MPAMSHNLTQAISIMRQLSEAEQRELNRFVCAEIKEKVRRRTQETLRQFRVGDKAVFWNKRDFSWVQITIEKINSTTVKGTQLTSGPYASRRGAPITWRVSPGLLRKVETAQQQPQGPKVTDMDFGGNDEAEVAPLALGYEGEG
jgi:hypothetical protein